MKLTDLCISAGNREITYFKQSYLRNQYHIASRKVWQVARKFDKFGESSAIRQTKPFKVTINNPLADLFICQTFFHQTLEMSKFAKHSPRQTFPLYGILNHNTNILHMFCYQ